MAEDEDKILNDCTCNRRASGRNVGVTRLTWKGQCGRVEVENRKSMIGKSQGGQIIIGNILRHHSSAGNTF